MGMGMGPECKDSTAVDQMLSTLLGSNPLFTTDEFGLADLIHSVEVSTDKDTAVWEHTIVVGYRPELPVSLAHLALAGAALVNQATTAMYCGCTRTITVTAASTEMAMAEVETTAGESAGCKGASGSSGKKKATHGDRLAPSAAAERQPKVMVNVGLVSVGMLGAVVVSIAVMAARRRREWAPIDAADNVGPDESTRLIAVHSQI